MSSIHDIARHAGVSVASVSRVFNKRPNVREEVKAKVLAAADALGYVPKQSAAKDCYAVLVQNFEVISHGGYGGMLLAALMKEIALRDGRIEIVTVNDLPLLKAKFFKGVVSTLFSSEALAELQDYDRPIVTINEPVAGVASVCSDEYQGMALAVEHLLEMGHRTIALLPGACDSYANRKRRECFMQLLHEKGVPVDDACVRSRREGEEAWQVTAKLMKKSPTAIIATGEEQGPALAYNLAMLGKRVPDDVSIITFEHCGISQVMTPAQTTICQDFETLSFSALQLLEQHDPEKQVLVDYKLIKRDSVKRIER